ncbi:MAG: hypothetical protein ABR953_03670 [Candidatus Acidiferrales bacterium]|jgi:hypothetical protein
MAVQLEVFGFIYNAHPAASEPRDNAVMGHKLADEEIGVGHGAGILRGSKRGVNADAAPVTVWEVRVLG